MTTLMAEFPDRSAVAPAINALAAAGFQRSAVELYSAKPVELPRGVLDRPSRMSFYAVIGALLSGGGATAFVYWTQLNYPLVTGAMPLNSGWATGVITFETTMAGAIAGTLCGLLLEGRFFRFWRWRPSKPLHHETVYLAIAARGEQADQAGRILREAGAIAVEESK